MPLPKQKLRLRILYDDDTAIGPGKATLLENIEETGSIAAAGRRMGMTYRRAWLLVDTMNRCFREPVVLAAKGGVGGGGATVTDFGRAVLADTDDSNHAQWQSSKNSSLARQSARHKAPQTRTTCSVCSASQQWVTDIFGQVHRSIIRCFWRCPVQLSLRNQLAGRVTGLRLGGVMAEVTIDIGAGKSVVSVITRRRPRRSGSRTATT